jgi:hypothetical protein
MSEQTERAEVEAALLSVTWPDGGREGLPTRKTAEMLAEAVVSMLAAAEARGAKAVLDDLLTRTQESILSSGFRQEVVLASDVRAAARGMEGGA